jgi:peptidoglycan hydrolase CwlO-like protein
MSLRDKKINSLSDKVTRWVGSPASVFAHTVFFIIMIGLAFTDIGFDKILLILTTVVSLEAIYLSIFIQMTVNKHSEELEEVSEDIEEIQGDIDEIQEDVEEISEDVGEIQKDVDEIQEDVENIEKDVDEIQEDVEVIEVKVK